MWSFLRPALLDIHSYNTVARNSYQACSNAGKKLNDTYSAQILDIEERGFQL